MISKLIGSVSYKYNNCIVLDVSFCECSVVGYEIIMKQSDFVLINIGDHVSLFIKEIISEDNDILYGFLSFEDKCWFEEMIKISGLGPKTSLLILSQYSCDTIIEAILTNNCDVFSSISGIGAKIANRIPMEMKKQIPKIQEKVINFGTKLPENQKTNIVEGKINTFCNISSQFANDVVKNKQQKQLKNKTNQQTIINDAVQALISLGFAKQNIYNDIYNIVKENNKSQTTEEIVKDFLKKLDK